MRVRPDGIEKGPKTIRFWLDEDVIEASPGDSIASAMLTAGRYVFRKSRSNTDRGLYCGMGVCGECQVLIDGESKRACMEKVANGLRVSRHPASRPLPVSEGDPAVREWSDLSPDVLVIGAGPGGLSAAIAAAQCGLTVLVIDERSQAGGQYFKQPSKEFDVDERRLDKQFVEGRHLIRMADEIGVEVRSGTTVWGSFENRKIAASSKDETLLISARRIVLSPGAYERPVPFPGWTLPGVITTGAAQTLLRAYRTAPGERVLVAGNGPLNIQVAHELCKSGVKVVAVVESAGSPFKSPIAGIRMMLNEPWLTLTGIRQMASLKSSGVPLHFRHVLVGATGKDRVGSATVARIDNSGRVLSETARHYDVDTVCVSNGFLPQSELARSLGCEYDYDHATSAMTVRGATDGRTNVEQVFVVGDSGCFGGARIAMSQGALAAYAIARDLGAPQRVEGRVLRRLRSDLKRQYQFQRALWSVYRAPNFAVELAAPDTIICRCEDLDLKTLQHCLSDGYHNLASIKKASRAGMGRCQGRYCSSLLTAIAANAGYATNGSSFFAPRPPIKPVPLSQMAGSYGQALQSTDLLDTDGRNANVLS